MYWQGIALKGLGGSLQPQEGDFNSEPHNLGWT